MLYHSGPRGCSCHFPVWFCTILALKLSWLLPCLSLVPFWTILDYSKPQGFPDHFPVWFCTILSHSWAQGSPVIFLSGLVPFCAILDPEAFLVTFLYGFAPFWTILAAEALLAISYLVLNHSGPQGATRHFPVWFWPTLGPEALLVTFLIL